MKTDTLPRRSRTNAEIPDRTEKVSRFLLESCRDGIATIDRHGILRTVNPAIIQMFGYPEEELIGHNVSMLMPEPHASQHDSYLRRHIETGETRIIGEAYRELTGRRKSGELFALELTITKLSLDDEVLFAGFMRDITERKRTEQMIEHQALHDSLTDLPNRAFLDRLLDERVQAAADNKLSVAVLFLDLDRFKRINDSFGHSAGDWLLCEIAERLRANLDPDCIIARHSGDELVVVPPLMHGTEPARRTARKICEVLARPFQYAGEKQPLHISASVGIALYPQDGSTPDALLQNADAAMYRAKNDGRNIITMYSRSMNTTSRERVQLEDHLHEALENDEFELHYQPQLDLRTGNISGAEALVRWNRGGDLVAPMEFIPLAEETGLIVPLGRWIFEQAARDYTRLAGQVRGEFSLSINCAASQFHSDTLLEHVQAITATSGVAPGNFTLEITESTFMRNLRRTRITLGGLKELGVRIAVDDFGTGYSSLAYLKRFPVDALKIDRAFVRGLCTGNEDRAIIQAIISLAQHLGLDSVAEGVEHDSQMKTLWKLRCDAIQGYGVCRPGPLNETLAFLRKHPSSPAHQSES